MIVNAEGTPVVAYSGVSGFPTPTEPGDFDCEDCNNSRYVVWNAEPHSRFPECREKHIDPCGICREWRGREERLALLQQIANGPCVENAAIAKKNIVTLVFLDWS